MTCPDSITPSADIGNLQSNVEDLESRLYGRWAGDIDLLQSRMDTADDSVEDTLRDFDMLRFRMDTAETNVTRLFSNDRILKTHCGSCKGLHTPTRAAS